MKKLKPKSPEAKTFTYNNLRPDLRKTLRLALKLGNLSIMPPRNDGSKKPYPSEWKQYQAVKTSKKQLVSWYSKGLTGIGLICGKVSDNLECLDFDDRSTFKQFCQRMRDRGLSGLLKRLKHGYLEYTPNGVHILYRCSQISGNVKLAKRPKKEQ